MAKGYEEQEQSTESNETVTDLRFAIIGESLVKITEALVQELMRHKKQRKFIQQAYKRLSIRHRNTEDASRACK